MKKDTVVILHGWGLSGKTFAPLIAELQKRGFRALAPDLPGFGGAPAPAYVWRLRDYVRFLERYLQKRRIGKPILIGHSFGGRVALKFSQLHPTSVSALILTGTPGFTPVPKKKLLLFVALAKIGRLIFSLPPLHLMRDQVRRWYYYVVGARDFFRAEGVMRDIFKTIVQEELVGAMQEVKVPCLLLWGEYDIIVPLPIAERMEDVIPKAKLIVVPEADHGVPFKQPLIFANYVELYFTEQVK